MFSCQNLGTFLFTFGSQKVLCFEDCSKRHQTMLPNFIRYTYKYLVWYNGIACDPVLNNPYTMLLTVN